MRSREYLAPFGMLACAAILTSGLGEQVSPSVPPAGLEAHETHASASLLGQFRTSASSMLWLRTDLYLHNGVEMRPLSEQEILDGKKGVGGAKDGHEALMNDDAIVTVVPSAERDFRGVFGDIERSVNAYKDMQGHTHRDPQQALPLFRLMTWLDPQFVTAWVTGATVIARDHSKEGTSKALGFLAEAEANNPHSVAIPTETARLLISRNKDLMGSEPFLEEAMRRGLQSSSKLPEIEMEGLNLACRLLALVYRDIGRPEEMHRHLALAKKLFKDDLLLRRLDENVPLTDKHRSKLPEKTGASSPHSMG